MNLLTVNDMDCKPEIVKPKNSRSAQHSVLFLCASANEVKRMGYDTLDELSYFEHQALVNFQCYLEQEIDKKDFKLGLSSSELVGYPSCPVTHQIHFDEYYVTRIVFNVNKDALNRVKISNRSMYKFLSEAFGGRLLIMSDFTHSLNNGT